MRVLQVCYKYPPFFSGYGKQLETINKEIVRADAGVAIHVITAYGRMRTRTCESGTTVYSMFKQKEGEGSRKYYYLFSLFILFRYFPLFLRADAIHIVKAGPEIIIPTALARLFNKRVIIKVAQDDLEGLLEDTPGIMRRIRRFFLRRADKVVALSGKIAEEAEALGVRAENIKRIPNGVDFNRFNCREAEASPNQPYARKFIFMGAVSRRKGIEDLLQALEAYSDDLILFSFYGPLLDIESFDQRLSKISEKAHVIAHYYGSVEQPELKMKEHDCLVLPSYSEGMPNVVLEAMACGLYVILSDINVHKELCEMAKGSCFKVGDPQDLLNKIRSFLSMTIDGKTKLLQSQSIEALASSRSVAGQYISLYRSCGDARVKERMA